MHVHSNDDENIKMHENLVTIILMSYTLSKLYVDIKFDVFNLKFRNHLFYPQVLVDRTLCCPPFLFFFFFY